MTDVHDLINKALFSKRVNSTSIICSTPATSVIEGSYSPEILAHKWLESLEYRVKNTDICQASCESTIKDVRPWLHFLRSFSCNYPTRVEVDLYLSLQFKHLANSTAVTRLRTLVKFYEWASERGFCDNICAHLSQKSIPRVPRVRYKWDQHIDRHLTSHLDPEDITDLRSCCIITLLRSGIQMVAIFRAKASDVDFESEMLSVHLSHHKEKDSILPLRKDALMYLKRYFLHRFATAEDIPDEPLITSQVGEALSMLSMRLVILHLARTIAHKSVKITSRSLRVAGLTDIMHEYGVDQTAMLMRTDRFNIMQIYASSGRDDLPDKRVEKTLSPSVVERLTNLGMKL